MRDILEEIVAAKRQEVARQKELLPLSRLERMTREAIDARPGCISMSRALSLSPTGIIAEFKRRSPSKGWIREDGTPETIPPSYAASGAAALSILTDEPYFGGEKDFIRRARPLVASTPILRKDFIIDEYQLLEARLIGADAVLLIAADLDRQRCRDLARTAHDLGLETLLEVHSEAELDYVGRDIDMVGVNNRNLGTFHTDVQNSFRLADLLPRDFVLVSESGISRAATVRELRQAGFRGFLIGETFMRADDPGAALRRFISDILEPLDTPRQ